MIALIICCEIGFWVCLAIGLAARYLLRAQRLSMAILLGALALDLVLLAATAMNIHRGATPEIGHALAAVYLGFSIAYGHRLIAWADVRLAHHFANGPAPTRLTGLAYAKACWGDVGRTALACVIAGLVTATLKSLAASETDTAALTANYRWLALATCAELIWAISYTVWPRNAKAASPAPLH